MRRRPFPPTGEFRFDRPLTLRKNTVVRTTGDAAAFVRSYANPRMPKTRATVLRWLERPGDEDQQSKAASMFRIWADSEGLLLKDK
jgi:hypothetical protein